MNFLTFLGLILSTNLVHGIETDSDSAILEEIFARIQSIEEGNSNFKSQIESLEIENTKLVTRISELQSSNDHRQAQWDQLKQTGRHEGEFIGFLAYPEASREYSSNSQVIFDIAQENVGAHYNTGTSTFTCPFDGYYWFAVVVLTDKPCGGCAYNDMFGEIQINRNGIIRATGKGSNDNHQGSTSGIMFCSAGSLVNVYATTSSNGNLNMIGSNESSFSGFLLWTGPFQQDNSTAVNA